MLKIHTLPLGAYQTNCYIVHEENAKTCAVIDPGYEAEIILDKVRSLGLSVDAILLTHGGRAAGGTHRLQARDERKRLVPAYRPHAQLLLSHCQL